MSSNTNLGNTPVSQGYTQLFHTGETGGLTSTLQQVFDGDGTGSDLYLATNKVKIGTAGNFLVGSKTIQEYIQDIVGDMLVTNGSHTNLTATYDDDGDGAIDLNAQGAVTGITAGTGITTSGSGNITINVNTSTIATRSYVDTEVSGLVDSAPGTLDTLNELASALGDDPNFATTTATNIGTKLAKASNLSDLTNAGTARTNLGVDPAGTDNSTNVTLAGSLNYLTLSGQQITRNAINLGTDVTSQLPIANGGTGATNVTTAKENLGLEIGIDVQAQDAGLTSISGLTTSANKMIYTTASDTYAVTDLTSTARSLLDDTSTTAMRATLGLGDGAILDTAGVSDGATTLATGNAIYDHVTTRISGKVDTSGSPVAQEYARFTDSNTIEGRSYAGVRTDLGLNIGTNVLAYNADLQTIAGLNPSVSENGKVLSWNEGNETYEFSDKLSPNGSTANGLLTYNTATIADVEQNLTFSSLTLQIPSASGKVSVDKIEGYSNNTNSLFLNDDQTLANNQVSLQSINHINIMTDGNNNGVGNFKVWNGSYDVDTADLAFQVNSSSNATFYGDVTISGTGDLKVPGTITHVGDTNTYIHFTNDRIRLYANGLKIDTDVDYVTSSRSISTSGGISGGGDLSADRSLSLSASQLSQVTLDASDQLILFDNSDSDNPKRFIAQDIFDTISGAVTSYTNTGNDRILTSSGGTTINGESNLTFDGDFKVSGNDSTFETISFDGSNGYLLLSGTASQRMEFRNTTTNANGWIGIPSWNTDAFYAYLPTASGNELAYIYESSRHNLYNDVALQATKKLYLDGGSDTYIDEPSGDQLRLVAGGTEVLKGYSGGAIDMYGGSTTSRSINIGANRSGNGYSWIDLVGDATYTNFGARFIRNNGGANTSTEIRHRGTGLLSLNAVDAGSVRFYTSNAERVRIDSSGNVGIGNIAPSNTFEVKSGSTTPFGIKNGSNSTRLQVSLTNDDADIFLYDRNGTLQTALRSEGDSYFNQGSVGIGIASPAFSYASKGLEIQTTDEQASLRLERTGGTPSVFEISARNSDILLYNVGTARAMRFGIGGTEAMRIDTSRNVLIGRTSAFSSARVEIQNDATEQLTLNNVSTDGKMLSLYNSGSIVGGLGNDVTELVIYQGTTEAIRIDTSQRVGIGTQSPASKFHVSGGDSRHSGGKLIYEAGGVSDYFRIQRASSSGRSQIQLANESGTELWRFGLTGGGSEDFSFWDGSFNHLVFDRSANSATFGGDVDITGSLITEGPDGGAFIGNWAASSSFAVFGTANMAGGEYALLTDGTNTFLGSGNGGATYFRGPANDSTPELVNNGTNIYMQNAGNFGIGTNSPSSYRLQFGNAGDKIGVDLSSGGTTRIAEIEFYNGSDGSLRLKTDNASTGGIEFHTEGSKRMIVARNGNVGVGNLTSPAQPFQTHGTSGDTRTRTSTSNHGTYFESGVTSDSAGILLVAGHASSILNVYLQGSGGTQNQFRFTHNGDFLADEDIVAYSTSVGSDRKLKNNIKDISYGLSDVMKIRAVEFDWKEKRDKAHDIGVIAQEIEEIIPEVVKEVETLNTDGETHKVVDYAKLSSVLIKAVQEQQEQINKLEEKLNG